MKNERLERAAVLVKKYEDWLSIPNNPNRYTEAMNMAKALLAEGEDMGFDEIDMTLLASQLTWAAGRRYVAHAHRIFSFWRFKMFR